MSTTDELEKLASLKDRGVLTREEFDQAKARLLATAPPQARPGTTPSFSRDEPSSTPTPPKKGLSGWAIGGIVAVVLIAAFLSFGATVANTPEAREQDRERIAIDLCWKDYGRKSLTPDAQRFVAGVCEKMEDDFRAKHHMEP